LSVIHYICVELCELVDWAALAQQWIQMKETLPAHQIPPAPPPPPPPPPAPDKVGCGEKKRDLGLEGGEAPMDMDTKDEAENSSSSNAPGRDMCCSSI